MSASPPPFDRSLLAPRHWPAWLGVGLGRLLASMPWPLLRRVGHGLGWLAARLLHSRRRIARQNIDLCLADWPAEQRAALVEANLRDAGMMLVEFALAWNASDRRIARLPMRLEGLEHLQRAREQGRGVLLVGGHFSHLELAARLVSQHLRIAGMYRVMSNPVLEYTILRARLGYSDAMFTKDQIRQSVRHLRNGGTLWYAPDQDMRGKERVFVPFFGIPAATITATHHLARMSGACVMPFFHRRLPDGSYELRLEAPLVDFPGSDPVADTARVSQCIEQMVRAAPEQYLWMHARFKTRPPGAEPVYRKD